MSGGVVYKDYGYRLCHRNTGITKRFLPAGMTAAKTGTPAVVPVPSRSGKDFHSPCWGSKGGTGGLVGKALNWNTVRTASRIG